jgi:hypothetical protein
MQIRSPEPPGVCAGRNASQHKTNEPSLPAGGSVPRELNCLAQGPLSGGRDVATWITIRVGLVSAFS